MRFKPSVQPTSSEKTKPAWWFVFRHDNLLVKLTDETASIPFVNDLSSLNLEPIRKQYLGSLDGHPCYSVECADDAQAPDGMDFRGLRGLFKLMGKDMFRVARRAVHIKNWDKENQYCGRCGTPTKTKKNESAKVCPKCNLLHYPRLSPAIIVAVVKGNRLLLARADRFPPGMYSVLAGFVEPGESLEECVRREVKEEVGIEVKNVHYFGSQHWPFPNSLMLGFTAEYAGGEIIMDETEIVDAGWFTNTNLPSVPGTVSIAGRLIEWFVKNHQQPPTEPVA